jgi:SAM-dependent methyltransferase
VKLWNSEAASTWATQPERYDAMLDALGRRVIAAAAPQPGERVLDVGCGAGQLTVQVAGEVGPTGHVTGLDVATDLLAVTSRRAAGVDNVEVLQADAQVHVLEPSSYDLVISRFGVMFFAEPVAAFTNLRSATKPGGRLAFVCWQSGVVNEWVTVPLFAAGAILGFPEPPSPDAPGPFAFADADRLRGILADAGWAGVEIEDVRTTVRPAGATTAEEATDFIVEDTFGKLLLDKAEPAQREAAIAAIRDAYAAHLTADGVELAAAVWVVTARRD